MPNRVYCMTYISIHNIYWNNSNLHAILHSIDYRFLAVGIRKRHCSNFSGIGSDRHVARTIPSSIVILLCALFNFNFRNDLSKRKLCRSSKGLLKVVVKGDRNQEISVSKEEPGKTLWHVSFKK